MNILTVGFDGNICVEVCGFFWLIARLAFFLGFSRFLGIFCFVGVFLLFGLGFDVIYGCHLGLGHDGRNDQKTRLAASRNPTGSRRDRK